MRWLLLRASKPRAMQRFALVILWKWELRSNWTALLCCPAPLLWFKARLLSQLCLLTRTVCRITCHPTWRMAIYSMNM